MKKVSEFLSDLDAWTIYDAKELADDFRKETGRKPCWPEHTMDATVKAMEERGLGGHIKPTDKPVAWGYEVAESLAEKLAGYKPWQMGRGSRFRSAIESLRKAGF